MAQEYQHPSPAGAGDAQEPNAAAVRVPGSRAQMIEGEAERGSEEPSVDMVELFFHILGKIHYVIIAAALGTLLACLYVHFFYVPTYQATAKLYIQNTSGITVSVGDMQVASNLTQDYREVFETWEVVEGVRDEMPLRTAGWEVPCTAAEAGEHKLTVSVPANTRVLYITVDHPRGEVAIEMANAYADHAMKFIMSHMGNAYEPTEFSAAKDAEVVGLTRLRILILGFLMGAGLVLAGLVLLFLLDERPRTPDDITRIAGIPTLAVVPREQHASRAGRRLPVKAKEGRK